MENDNPENSVIYLALTLRNEKKILLAKMQIPELTFQRTKADLISTVEVLHMDVARFFFRGATQPRFRNKYVMTLQHEFLSSYGHDFCWFPESRKKTSYKNQQRNTSSYHGVADRFFYILIFRCEIFEACYTIFVSKFIWRTYNISNIHIIIQRTLSKVLIVKYYRFHIKKYLFLLYFYISLILDLVQMLCSYLRLYPIKTFYYGKFL